MNRTGLLTFAFSITLSACSNADNDDFDQLDKEQRFSLTSAISMEAVDLNFDGIYNTDLTSEISSLNRSLLILLHESAVVNIIWEEPRVNNGQIGILPENYLAEMVIDYYPVQHLYAFSENNGFIIPYQRIESVNQTFSFPERIKVVDSQNLEFSTKQYYMTREGRQLVDISCSFSAIE